MEEQRDLNNAYDQIKAKNRKRLSSMWDPPEYNRPNRKKNDETDPKGDT